MIGAKCGLRQIFKKKKKHRTLIELLAVTLRDKQQNKIKDQSANSIDGINIYHLYWRRHAERERTKTGSLKSSGHMNLANRENQEILGQGRDKFN